MIHAPRICSMPFRDGHSGWPRSCRCTAKILTIVTTVFLPLSLIAGWYGMNFVNMPELQSANGYRIVCIASALCVVLELLIFKWKKWF